MDIKNNRFTGSDSNLGASTLHINLSPRGTNAPQVEGNSPGLRILSSANTMYHRSTYLKNDSHFSGFANSRCQSLRLTFNSNPMISRPRLGQNPNANASIDRPAVAKPVPSRTSSSNPQSGGP